MAVAKSPNKPTATLPGTEYWARGASPDKFKSVIHCISRHQEVRKEEEKLDIPTYTRTYHRIRNSVVIWSHLFIWIVSLDQIQEGPEKHPDDKMAEKRQYKRPKR